MASPASDANERSRHTQSAEGISANEDESSRVESVIVVGREESTTRSDGTGSRSSSALFVSEDSPGSTTSPMAVDDGITVEVPMVRQRSLYQECPSETTVRRILRELGAAKGKVNYQVRFDDGHEEIVSHNNHNCIFQQSTLSCLELSTVYLGVLLQVILHA